MQCYFELPYFLYRLFMNMLQYASPQQEVKVPLKGMISPPCRYFFYRNPSIFDAHIRFAVFQLVTYIQYCHGNRSGMFYQT